MIKEIFNKANIVTFVGLMIAIVGMIFCFTDKIDFAVVCLAICGICDGFDGTIARKLRKKDDGGFGIQLDSLVDIVASGILPIIICISLNYLQPIECVIYILFIICGVTRLAYYNIHTFEDNKNFVGFPITSSTIILPLIYFLLRNEMILIASIFLLAILFIVPIKIKKLSFKGKIILSVLGVIVITIIHILGVING